MLYGWWCLKNEESLSPEVTYNGHAKEHTKFRWKKHSVYTIEKTPTQKNGDFLFCPDAFRTCIGHIVGNTESTENYNKWMIETDRSNYDIN